MGGLGYERVVWEETRRYLKRVLLVVVAGELDMVQHLGGEGHPVRVGIFPKFVEDFSQESETEILSTPHPTSLVLGHLRSFL